MSKTPRIATCKNCNHYLPDDVESKNPQGLCRESPPQATIVMLPVKTALGQGAMQPQTIAAWPPVQENQWCGKHAIHFERPRLN